MSARRSDPLRHLSTESASPPGDKPPIIGFKIWRAHRVHRRQRQRLVDTMYWPSKGLRIRVSPVLAVAEPPQEAWEIHSVGPGNGYPWEKGELVADCRYPRSLADWSYWQEGMPSESVHPIPVSGCTCGFYAWTSYRGTTSHASRRRAESPWEVHGAVLMYGRVEYGDNVIRAEKCQILCFILPDVTVDEDRLGASPCGLTPWGSGPMRYSGVAGIGRRAGRRRGPVRGSSFPAPRVGDDARHEEEEALYTSLGRSMELPVIPSWGYEPYVTEFGEMIHKT